MENEKVQLIDEKSGVALKSKKVTDMPLGYIPVKFCTKGKLSAPPVLHFRDYNMEEAIELSAITDENYLSRLVIVLNQMVHEDFDCSQLHLEELKEVLLNIHLNFWGSTLRDFPGLSPEKKREHKDVPIKNIQVDSLDKKFKEPITITDSIGNKIQVRLPRVSDNLEVQEYVNTHFALEEKDFAMVKLQIERGGLKDLSKISDPEKVKEYMEFLEIKAKTYNLAHRMNRVLQFNDETPLTLEEKLAYASRIQLSVWASLRRQVIEKYTFGVNSEVNIDGQAWRFQFRTVAFLPSLELSDDPRNVVSFGT